MLTLDRRGLYFRPLVNGAPFERCTGTRRQRERAAGYELRGNAPSLRPLRRGRFLKIWQVICVGTRVDALSAKTE